MREFKNRSVVYQALQGKGDSDYIIRAIATYAGCQETLTFDRIKGEKGFRCFIQD